MKSRVEIEERISRLKEILDVCPDTESRIYYEGLVFQLEWVLDES